MSGEAARRRVGVWLALWAGMVVVLIAIGGATRLTESGLSITEWKPVTGVVPPLGTAAWEAEFARYQQIPEYQQFNQGMTLAQFRVIYLWEFTHRLWARLVGLAFALPLAVFALRGVVRGALARRLGALLVLLALQGAMGWYMVQSGLADRVDVSQYRLAAHLALALVLYGAAVWTAAELLGVAGVAGGAGADIEGLARLRGRATALAVWVFVTMVSGAFVAGLNAGQAWNTFPLMGGQVVPPGYAALHPWYLNLFENVAAVQFHHRLLAMAAALFAVILWWSSRTSPLAPLARRYFSLLPIVALAQVGLGVATLLLRVPVVLGVAHQLGAVAVLTAALLARATLQTTNGRREAPAVVTAAEVAGVS